MTKKSKSKGKLKVARRSVRKIGEGALGKAQGGFNQPNQDTGGEDTAVCVAGTTNCVSEYCGHYTDTNISCGAKGVTACAVTLKQGGGANNHVQWLRR